MSMAGSATSNLEGRQSSSQWLSLVALGACVTACTLEITMLFPALPALIRDFAALATSTVADRSGGVARYPTDDAFTLTIAYVALMCVLSVFVVLMLPKRMRALAVGTARS
jgi:hypothetical protein